RDRARRHTPGRAGDRRVEPLEVVRFLLDTNTLAAAARLNKPVLRTLESHEGECAASAISLHEMEWGYEQLGPGKTKVMVQEFLKVVYRDSQSSLTMLRPHGGTPRSAAAGRSCWTR